MPQSGFISLPLITRASHVAPHPFVEEDEGLQEVIDAGAGLLRGQAVQQQLQGPHPLRHQVDGAVLHRAGQEAQQTRVPQGLQVLTEERERGREREREKGSD